MFKNKTILISVLTLVIIFALAALFKFVFFKSTVPIAQNVNNKVTADQSAAAASDANCRKITSSAERDRCFNGNGLRYQNVGSCNQITDEAVKKSCQNIVVTETASRDKKLDDCLNISAKDECFAAALGIRDGWSVCVQGNDQTNCLEKLFTAEAIKQSNSFICQALLNQTSCLVKATAGK